MAERVPPITMLALLGVQYLTGIFVNLYVSVPHLGMGMMGMTGMMNVGAMFPVHVMLGGLIGVGALVTIGLARSRGKRVATWAAIGAIGVITSGVGGMLFLVDGQANGYSYLMAVGFLFAVMGYVGELIAV